MKPNRPKTHDKDEPTVLPPDEMALVTSDGGKDLHMYLPAETDGDMPPAAVFLSACFLRSFQDQGFVDEMIEWMGEEFDKLPSKSN